MLRASNSRLSPLFRLYRQYWIVAHICSGIGLHVDRPAMRVDLEWSQIHLVMGVNDVVEWTGRSPGSFANRRRLMRGMDMGLAFLQFRSRNSSRMNDVEEITFRALQAFTIPYHFAADIPLENLPYSISTWTVNDVQACLDRLPITY